jgi:hypothetical protein
MTLKIEIEDGKFGTANTVGVTKRGQLITAPLKFNTGYFQSMTSAATAFNFVIPQAGQQFVIDGIIFSSDKNVSSTNGAVIDIYESNIGPDSTTIDKSLLRIDIGRLDKGNVSSLNMITSPSVWINGFTDDATTNVTLIGYYVEVVT